MNSSSRLSLMLLAVSFAARVSVAQTPAPRAGTSAGGSNYEARDRSISLRVPAGWKASQQDAAGTTFHVLEREGGLEKILVNTGPATANSLQELAVQAMQLVPQVLPGLQPASRPAPTQVGGVQAIEISYRGVAQSGEVMWWQSLMLQNSRFISVLGGGPSSQSQMVRQQCQAVAASVRLGKVGENTELARGILGHWNYYHATTPIGRVEGSVTKEITFYPNGRYQYKAATYVPNMPADVNPITEITGTYRIEGNTIYYKTDQGQTGSFAIQLTNGGQMLTIGGDRYTR